MEGDEADGLEEPSDFKVRKMEGMRGERHEGRIDLEREESVESTR